MLTASASHHHNNTSSSAASAASSNSSSNITVPDQVKDVADAFFGTLSSWSSSVQKTFEATFANTTTTNNQQGVSTSSVTTPSSSSTSAKVSTPPSPLNNNNNVAATMSSNKKLQNQPQQQPIMMEKRSLIRNQDFSSGDDDEDEESIIGTLRKGSSSLGKPTSSSSSSWFDSFQSIKNQLLSDNNDGKDFNDGPITKPLKSNSKTSSPSTHTTSSPSTGNNIYDSLNSTFSSLKNQTTDKWGLLKDQFFDSNQNIIDENDNTFLGKLSKEWDGMVTLSAKQRMYGFFMALGFGLLCIIIALGFLPSIIFATGAFAFFYTFGNLLCLTSTLFLVGPVAQIKNMTKPERAIPSALFIGSMFFTLICVFVMPIALLIILLVIVQTVSLAWYVVSYIPFAQQILGMVFSSFMRIFN